MNYLFNIEKMTNSREFLEADKGIKHILALRVYLEILISDELFIKINNLRSLQKKLIMNSVEALSSVDIKDYFIYRPVNIFNELTKISGQTYDARNRLRDIIILKYQVEIKNAKISSVFGQVRLNR